MLIPLTLLLLVIEGHAAGRSRFTNIQCDILDIGYITYPKCHLKMLGRGVVGLNIHLKLLQPPVTTVKVIKCIFIWVYKFIKFIHFQLQINLSLWRKFNGFRPFMFNKTFDYCRFAAKKNPKLSFESIVFSAITEKSNANHSCPYDVSTSLSIYF